MHAKPVSDYSIAGAPCSLFYLSAARQVLLLPLLTMLLWLLLLPLLPLLLLLLRENSKLETPYALGD